MKFKFLLNKFDGNDSGGGAKSGDTNQRSAERNEASEGSDRNDNNNNNDSDGSGDKQSTRRTESGGSVLLGAINSAEENFEKTKDGKEDSQKEDDTKEDNTSDSKNESSSKEETTEDDFDESKLKGRNGQPISGETSKFIKNLKTKYTAAQEKIKELTAKSGSQLTEKQQEEYTKLVAEHKDLKDKYDDYFFEQSEAFKSAFAKPIEETSKKISVFFKGLDKEDQSLLAKAFDSAIEAAESDDKISYYKAVDKILEDFMDDAGHSATKAFGAEMDRFYDALKAKADAVSQKGEGRKKMVEIELEKRRSKNVMSVDSGLTRHIKLFETKKSAVLTGLKGDDLEEYKNLYMKENDKVKKHLTSFAVTGEVPDELAEVIANGVTAKAVEHEAKLAWVAYKTVNNKLADATDEIKELKAKLAKYTTGPGKTNGSYTNNTKESSSKIPKGGSILGAAIRSIQG